MSATLEKFAQPGDADLDLDIDGVSITNVVCNGKDVLVRMEGGFGQWINADEDDLREVDNVTEVEMTMCFPVASDDFIEKLVNRLNDWRARNVPMRICAAPGRMTSLIEDAQHWLPLPRNWPPPAAESPETP